jgi:hypothetical protein
MLVSATPELIDALGLCHDLASLASNVKVVEMLTSLDASIAIVAVNEQVAVLGMWHAANEA